MSDLVETSVISPGSISVSVTEPWVTEGDSVVFRELQFRHTGSQLHIQ